MAEFEKYDILAFTLCAYRLDPNVSAETFADILERLIDAVRRDEQQRLTKEING